MATEHDHDRAPTTPGKAADGDSSALIPDADPAPTGASKYSTAEEPVVTREDRDPDDNDA